ncbi:MAG: ATP-dependent helicase [bacterium]|nr:ATP-dependent helicase [bacterium]
MSQGSELFEMSSDTRVSDPRQRIRDRAAEALAEFSLNDEQRRAVDHDGSPLIVLAGPGTGKTRTIIGRILRLLADGAKPESILAMTFTNKAAGEMTERLEEMVGPEAASRVQMGTFHAFGSRLIARYADMLGLPERPDIMDSAQRRRLLRKIIEEHALYRFRASEGTDALIGPIATFIERCREAARSPQDALDFAAEWERLNDSGQTVEGEDADETALSAEAERRRMFAENARAYELFVTASRQARVVTFNDFITLPTELLREREIVRNIIRDEVRHVVVDEFQDVNAAQVEMLRQIIPPRAEGRPGPDLCVVGDDDQAIYAFRGSDPKAFARFREIWTNAEQVELSINYRSRPEVIEVGNTVIGLANERFAPDKQSRANPDGPSDAGVLETVEVANDNLTGQVIASLIKKARADAEEQGDYLPFSSFGVITRTNGFADEIAAELRLNDIEVDRRREISPLDDDAVHDVLAWVRLLIDPEDESALQRLLVRWPQRMDPDRVRRLTTLYRRAKSESTPNTETFGAWIEHHIATEPDDKEAEIHTFFENLASLRQIASAATADTVLEDIIRRSNLMHEPVPAGFDHPGEQRARRVENLVQMIRFARERLDQFDQPPTLESFWNYYQDLDDSEREFAFPSRENVDESGADAEESDAVTVISAHKAKGLEFDTVFVARVRSPHGFPYRAGGRDEEPLPASFTGRPEPNADDEERRLFFVACTRAERRLVLIAQRQKSRGVGFYPELTQDAPHLGFQTTDSDSVLDTAEAMGLDALAGELRSVDAAKAAVNRTATEAWEEATRVLHALDRTGVEPKEIEALLDRLVDAARVIPAIASIRSTGRLPSELAPDGDTGLAPRVRRLAAQLPDLSVAMDCTRPMTGPLSLSYSQLHAFAHCPRCFYVKYVLRLDEPKTTALSVGDIAHKALELFYRRFKLAEAEGTQLPGLTDLQKLAEAEFENSWPRHLPMDRSELDRIKSQLEKAYLRLHSDQDEPIYLEETVKLPYTLDKQTHTIIAKIDRVDRLDGGAWRVIDYKTGKASKRLLEPDKSDLQMAIYAMALPELVEPGSSANGDLPSGVAEYWLLATGERGVIGFDALRIDKVREKIDESIRKMLAGEFERGKKCRNGICRLLPD